MTNQKKHNNKTKKHNLKQTPNHQSLTLSDRQALIKFGLGFLAMVLVAVSISLYFMLREPPDQLSTPTPSSVSLTPVPPIPAERCMVKT